MKSVPGAVATGLRQDGETQSLPLPALTSQHKSFDSRPAALILIRES
jgi:hypothetical protein